MKHSLIVAAILLLLLPSCASMFTGTKQAIQFQSEPPGAKVQINGVEVGTTPCTVPVKKSSRLVTYSLAGYKDQQFEMGRKFNAVSLINIFVPLGFIIDAATGSINKFDSDTYKITLEKANPHPTSNQE